MLYHETKVKQKKKQKTIDIVIKYYTVKIQFYFFNMIFLKKFV